MMCRVKFCHPSEHPPTSAPPSPPQVEQVRAVYSALRENTHAAQLGFKTSPLVVSGLSAGGNLATAALLYHLLQPRLLRRSLGGSCGCTFPKMPSGRRSTSQN